MLFTPFFSVLASALPAPAAPISAPPVKAARPVWIPMPLATEKMRKAGLIGGEGAQVPRDLVLSTADPNFLLLGIDVGGLYRTLDGGKRWEPANVGWNARGANTFAIDPKNPNRVLGVAGNSMDWSVNGVGVHGVYLSTNKAGSWRQVLPMNDGFDGSLAIDPASFDAERGFCPTVYFASRSQGVWKSLNGGETWKQVYANLNAVRLKMHPNGKTLFAYGVSPEGKGVYKSENGGKTFEKLTDRAAFGFDVCPKEPNSVWMSGEGGVYKSTDLGKTFQKLRLTFAEEAPPQEAVIKNVHISPADPNVMTCWYEGPNWHHLYFYTEDGKTLRRSRFEGIDAKGKRVFTGNNVLPYNVREGLTAFHPTDPKLIYSIGGDWVTRSTDGGANYLWRANGYNGVMVGLTFNFSPDTPDSVFLSFQDYNGAFTRDGGLTWHYRDVSGSDWGGFCYGGYTPDGKLMFCGNAQSWGAPRTLRLSYDGGTTWQNARDKAGKPCVFSGSDIGYSVPGEPSRCFASNFKSTDGGQTWSAMPDCDGVFISNPGGPHELYGRKGDAVVVSKDKGATWQKVADCPGGLRDAAYDPVKKAVYVVSEDRLKVYANGAWKTLETPPDQYGNVRLRSVAIDPQAANVVYIGTANDVYASHSAIARSTDGGQTWTNLANNTPLENGVTDSPREVQIVRVHPKTREAWVNGECFGMWKIAPPAPDERGVPAAQAAAPPAPKLSVPAASRPIILKNGGMEEGDALPAFWDNRWTGSGKLEVTKDRESKAGKFSLKIKSVGGAAKGQTAQVIEAPAGTKVVLSGFVKTAGAAVVNVAVQAYRDNWSPISFQQVQYAQNTSDWTKFSREITLPEGTARFGIVLLLDGDGSAWLDEVGLSIR